MPIYSLLARVNVCLHLEMFCWRQMGLPSKTLYQSKSSFCKLNCILMVDIFHYLLFSALLYNSFALLLPTLNSVSNIGKDVLLPSTRFVKYQGFFYSVCHPNNVFPSVMHLWHLIYFTQNGKIFMAAQFSFTLKIHHIYHCLFFFLLVFIVVIQRCTYVTPNLF